MDLQSSRQHWSTSLLRSLAGHVDPLTRAIPPEGESMRMVDFVGEALLGLWFLFQDAMFFEKHIGIEVNRLASTILLLAEQKLVELSCLDAQSATKGTLGGSWQLEKGLELGNDFRTAIVDGIAMWEKGHCRRQLEHAKSSQESPPCHWLLFSPFCCSHCCCHLQ